MSEIIKQYFQILIDSFIFDVAVFSEPWMYYLLLIPASLYLAFFFVKWTILTTPIWLPIIIICGGIKSIAKNNSPIEKTPPVPEYSYDQAPPASWDALKSALANTNPDFIRAAINIQLMFQPSKEIYEFLTRTLDLCSTQYIHKSKVNPEEKQKE